MKVLTCLKFDANWLSLNYSSSDTWHDIKHSNIVYLEKRNSFILITEDRDTGPDLRSSEGSCIGASVTHVSLI